MDFRDIDYNIIKCGLTHNNVNNKLESEIVRFFTSFIQI